MGSKRHSPLRLFANALRGVGEAFGGPRQVEFRPALPGGHGSATVLDIETGPLENVQCAASPKTRVITWVVPDQPPTGLTLAELSGLAYEGQGVWRLRDSRRLCLLGDEHIVPAAGATDAHTLINALRGDGSRTSAAHSLVIHEAGLYGPICEIVNFIEPALEAGASRATDVSMQAYVKSAAKRGEIILSCRNLQTEAIHGFTLQTLLAVRYCGEGLFELPGGVRFSVLALRPVCPERVRPSRHGFALPRMEFRAPTEALH